MLEFAATATGACFIPSDVQRVPDWVFSYLYPCFFVCPMSLRSAYASLGLWVILAVVVGPFTLLGEPPIPSVSWFTADMTDDLYPSGKKEVDTGLTHFQRYDFIYREAPLFAHKGNIGHPTRLLLFRPPAWESFSLSGPELFPGTRLLADRARHYRPEHVFTDLFYSTGSDREQSFCAVHAQQFHPGVYGGMMYQVVNSPGLYSRMGARHSSVQLSLEYAHPDGRYQVLGSFTSNRLEFQESGGLRNHLFFEEDEARDSVFLYQATARFRESAVSIRQSFYPGGAQPANSQGPPERSGRLGRISHQFMYRTIAHAFEEPAPPYPYYYFPPANFSSTLDSTRVMMLQNRLEWSNIPVANGRDAFPFRFALSLQHAYIDIRQPDFPSTENGGGEMSAANEEVDYHHRRTNVHQFEQEVRIQSDPDRFISGGGEARFVFGGYHDEDMYLEGRLQIGGRGGVHNLQLSAGFMQREAPYFMQHFHSNYISWDHDFEKTRSFWAAAAYTRSVIQLNARYLLLNNMVFMNRFMMAEQNPATFSVIGLDLLANLDFGLFRSRHHLAYQYVGSRRFEQFPPWVSAHAFFADFSLFDRALYVQSGLDIRYLSSYYPMGYMPVVRQFFVQEAYQSDHVFLVDVFLNLKIQRVRLFIKYEHFLGLLFDLGPVYTIPFYPLPENTIKFGVSWQFYD